MPDGPPPVPGSRFGDADRDRLTGILREHYPRRAPPLGAPGPGKRAPGRRHAQTAAPGPGWVPTAERFRDPTTGTVMRVWLDPADQSRHYVPDAAS